MDDPMLTAVKLAMAITVTDYDEELNDLIAAARADLKSNGIKVDALAAASDPLLLQAVKTYCRAMFQSPADYDKLLDSYNMQKGHMMHCTGYTTWPGEATSNAQG